MTTISFRFRPSKVEGKAGSIYLQASKDRCTIATVFKDYKVYPEEWDNRRQCLIINTGDPIRKTRMEDFYELMMSDKKLLDEIDYELIRTHIPYTVKELLNIYYSRKAGQSIAAFVEKIIPEIKSQKTRTTRSYRCTVRKLKRFADGADITFEQLTPEYIKRFEQYMHSRGNVPNTISYYMRNLRIIVNRAVRDKIIKRPVESLFADVFTGNEKTEKRAVKEETIFELRDLCLTGDANQEQVESQKQPSKQKQSLALTRDMFLLSYYMRGMSYIDVAYLKKENVNGDCLVYTRHKTGQHLEVEITDKMQTLIDLYHSDKSDYLFPMLRQNDSRKAYDCALQRMNRDLKKLSRMLKLDTPLTTYVARHSWASVAYAKDVSIDKISLGLGHESVKTTMIYLKSFDYSSLHAANRRVIDDGKNLA